MRTTAILGILAGLAWADGFHGVPTKPPREWARDVETVISRSRDVPTGTDAPPAPRPPDLGPIILDLIHKLQYLGPQNVFTREYPQFRPETCTQYRSEAERLLIRVGAPAAPYLVDALEDLARWRTVADQDARIERIMEKIRSLQQGPGLVMNADFGQRLHNTLKSIGGAAVTRTVERGLYLAWLASGDGREAQKQIDRLRAAVNAKQCDLRLVRQMRANYGAELNDVLLRAPRPEAGRRRAPPAQRALEGSVRPDRGVPHARSGDRRGACAAARGAAPDGGARRAGQGARDAAGAVPRADPRDGPTRRSRARGAPRDGEGPGEARRDQAAPALIIRAGP